MRITKAADAAWVFPARTRSGRGKAAILSLLASRNSVSVATRLVREDTGDPKRAFEGFELYTLRHTCLSRWAPDMDLWTLAYLAGHRDMNITKRYVHPQEKTSLEAMEKARVAKGRHKSGRNADLTQDSDKLELAAIN